MSPTVRVIVDALDRPTRVGVGSGAQDIAPAGAVLDWERMDNYAEGQSSVLKYRTNSSELT